MNLRERLLGQPFVYKTFKNAVSPPRRVERTVREFLMVRLGGSVLDLGCGYGDLAPYFEGHARYVGIDLNERYIAEACRRNSGPGVEFLVGDISDPVVLDRGPYDLVFLTGVLHHLDSDQVRSIARASTRLVGPKGRFVAIEPVFSPDQRLSARLIIAADRGRYVRDLEGYQALLTEGFEQVDAAVVHGRLRIPYSHVVLSATHPR